MSLWRRAAASLRSCVHCQAKPFGAGLRPRVTKHRFHRVGCHLGRRPRRQHRRPTRQPYPESRTKPTTGPPLGDTNARGPTAARARARPRRRCIRHADVGSRRHGAGRPRCRTVAGAYPSTVVVVAALTLHVWRGPAPRKRHDQRATARPTHAESPAESAAALRARKCGHTLVIDLQALINCCRGARVQCRAYPPTADAHA